MCNNAVYYIGMLYRHTDIFSYG